MVPSPYLGTRGRRGGRRRAVRALSQEHVEGEEGRKGGREGRREGGREGGREVPDVVVALVKS